MKTLIIGLAAANVFWTLGITPASAAATAPAAGIPCSGVWKLNESLTHRTRSPVGPIYQFFEPWGPNGWMRMNTGDLETSKSGEWHFEQFNGKPYQVFGGDPSLQHSRMLTDHIFETIRVREGKESDYSLVIFSKDCKRVTYYFPEGDDRHGEPGKQHYYNDIRVFDKIEPQPANVTSSSAIFGGWELNRQISKLTAVPMDAETIVIVPWEKAGWIWNQLSGGPYQPEDLHKAVKRVECGATQGATTIACKGAEPHMMLYWATWDSKPFPSYGTQRVQVQVKQINDRTFEATLLKKGATQADVATIAFSPDTKHMTVTTKSGAPNGPAHFNDDVRVYDHIEAANWPTVKP